MDTNFKQFSQAAVPSVPTFLQKLVALLNEDENHEYIDWNETGTSFIVKDQSKFSKLVLPKYFKHSNFASFVRQLNMYGFRKINSINQSGLHKSNEFIEFQHYLFVRGQEFLLEHIKRKVNKSVELTKLSSQELIKVLDDVHKIKDSHEDITGSISELRQENEDLWREVVTLRQKHSQQQRVLNKVIQFLVSLVQQHNIGTPSSRKRKRPLMLEDTSNAHLKLSKNNTFTPINNPALISVPTISEIESTSPVSDQTLLYTNTLPSMGTHGDNNNDSVTKSPIVTSPPDSTSNNVVQILTEDDDQSTETESIDVDSYLNDFMVDSQFKSNGKDATDKSSVQFEETKNVEVSEPATPVSGPALSDFVKANVATTSDPIVPSNPTVSPSQGLKLDISSAKNKQLAQYNRTHSKVVEPEILEERLDNVQGNLNSLHTLLNSPTSGVNLDFSLIQELFNPNSDMPDFNDYSGFQDGTLGTLASTSGPLVPRDTEPTQTDLDELSKLL